MNLQQTGKSAAAAAEKWLTNLRADKRHKRKIGKIYGAFAERCFYLAWDLFCSIRCSLP